MVNLKKNLQKMDIVDQCTRERAKTKWKIHKPTNVTIFSSLSKDIPLGCKDTVAPETLLETQNIKCLALERNTTQPYIENLCLLQALALQFRDNDKLEEQISKFFNLFLSNCEERHPSKFQVVHINALPKNEELLQLNVVLHNIDFVNGKLNGELVRRSIQKYAEVSSFRVTTITFATSTTSTRCSERSDAVIVTRFSQRLVI